MTKHVVLPVNSLADAQREIERLARLLNTVSDSSVVVGGPAGGVLGGQFPDPGFAEDMATQAELDAALAKISLSTGIKGEIWNQGDVLVPQDSSKIRVPYNFTITGAEITADVVGSISVEVYRSTYLNWNVFDKISGGLPVVLTVQKKNQSSIAGWITAIHTGDYLMFRIIGTPISVREVTITLLGVRT